MQHPKSLLYVLTLLSVLFSVGGSAHAATESDLTVFASYACISSDGFGVWNTITFKGQNAGLEIWVYEEASGASHGFWVPIGKIDDADSKCDRYPTNLQVFHGDAATALTIHASVRHIPDDLNLATVAKQVSSALLTGGCIAFAVGASGGALAAVAALGCAGVSSTLLRPEDLQARTAQLGEELVDKDDIELVRKLRVLGSGEVKVESAQSKQIDIDIVGKDFQGSLVLKAKVEPAPLPPQPATVEPVTEQGLEPATLP